MLALRKPKNAVTISIIATVLKPFAHRNDMRGRTVKRISNGSENRNPTDDLQQHRVREEWRRLAIWAARSWDARLPARALPSSRHIRECRAAAGHPPAGRPSNAACRRWSRPAFGRRRRPIALGMRGRERPNGGLRSNSSRRDATGLWPPPHAIMAGMRRLRGWRWQARAEGATRRRTK